MVTTSESDTFTAREFLEIFQDLVKDGGGDTRVYVNIGARQLRLNATSYGIYLNGGKQKDSYFELMADRSDLEA
jgi:hypothetical protein